MEKRGHLDHVIELAKRAKERAPDSGSERFARVRSLLKGGYERLANSSVVIFGIGGVGGAALDALYRSGVTNIMIIDRDTFEPSNQNRQIGSDAIGAPKVEELARIYDGVGALKMNIDLHLLKHLPAFDYYIDAIDDMQAKLQLASFYSHIPYGRYIASMGSAKKLNPLYIKVARMKNTNGCRFSKKYRDLLKKSKIPMEFKCVYSDEPPLCKDLGSCMTVTASFGLQIASEIIRDIIA